MSIYVSIISMVIGAILGSFLNVIIFRYSREGMTINTPRRSVCPKCGKQLKWYDNIPVASYIVLHGKCRYCGQKISARYIIVELLTLMTFYMNSLFSPQLLPLIGMDIITASLIVVFFIDIDTYTISDWNSIFIAIGGLIMTAYSGSWALNLITAAVAFAVMILLYFLSKKGLGMGDILLISSCALALGPFKTVMFIFVACICGILAAVILHKKMKDKIPFGPFLAIGAYLALIFGNDVLSLFIL